MNGRGERRSMFDVQCSMFDVFKLSILCTTMLMVTVAPAHAVTTEKVSHDTFGEFSGGDFENISLTSDGYLELAPGMTNIADVADPIIWAAVQDEKGNVYFGTGNQGKIYKLTPKGELTTFFAPNEVMVHALAIDSKGRLYAATSPPGHVYRFDANGRAEVYCNPGEAYIWAMVFGKDGALYLATGDKGKVLRIPATDSTPAKAETYFDSAEANITTLAVDNDGNLLAGTSPNGYLYRIDKANHGFVLFNSGDKEIKQIAVASNGVIFASTFVADAGSSSASSSRPAVISISMNNSGDDASKPSPSPAGDDNRMAILSNGTNAAALNPSANGSTAAGAAMGAIYRIDTNGFFERYWSAPGEAIYSMLLLPNGALLAGTGGKGRIYSITDANHWKLLQQTADGAQVAALWSGNGKDQFAATSHPGKIYRLDFALAENGTFTSKAFDARQKSFWGKLRPDADVPAGVKLEFSTRSGNTDKPEKTWSDWSDGKSSADEIAVTSPNARYLQYRAKLKRDHNTAGATAQLRRVQFYFQNQNAAPVIQRVKVMAEGFGVSKMPMPQMDAPAVNLSQLLDSDATAGAGMMMRPQLKMTKAPGLCTVVWNATDPNQDKLTYSVAIRGESEKQWTMLMEKTDENYYSFDTSGFREGLYYVRVIASDATANTPETARSTEAISAGFLVDNAAPVLTAKKQTVEKNTAHIVVNALDAASVVSAAVYSIDGKDEVALSPDDSIFDSTNETFTIELSNLAKGPHGIIVRAQDEAKNASVLKVNFEVQ